MAHRTPPPNAARRLTRRAATVPAVPAVLLVLAGAAGCTGGSAAPTAPATVPVAIHSAAVTPGAEAGTKTALSGCRIVSGAVVQRHFGGRVASVSAGTTPLGQPMCSFVVAASALGASGVVSAVLTAHSSAAAYGRARSAAPGAQPVRGVGSDAFYVPATGTVTALVHRALVLVHADFRTPGAPIRHAARLRADVLALTRSIASTQ